MALTPEDIVSKRFTTTKFRDGYDQDEVDDFLDEVVSEVRRLVKENEELRGGASSATMPQPTFETSRLTPVADAVGSDDSSHSLLELARKLHDQHVTDGLTKRDELVQEGQDTASRIIRESESKVRKELADYEVEKSKIQGEIQELRAFETQYRDELERYIRSHLEELQTQSSSAVAADSLDQEGK